MKGFKYLTWYEDISYFLYRKFPHILQFEYLGTFLLL